MTYFNKLDNQITLQKGSLVIHIPSLLLSSDILYHQHLQCTFLRYNLFTNLYYNTNFLKYKFAKIPNYN